MVKCMQIRYMHILLRYTWKYIRINWGALKEPPSQPDYTLEQLCQNCWAGTQPAECVQVPRVIPMCSQDREALPSAGS